MTGSPEPAGFAVVTALLCTAEEFPGELGDDYPAACAALGLETSSEGYALLLGQDASGAYWTQISTDVDSVTAALSIWAMGNEADVIVEIATVVATCPGWPVEYAISLADRPEPHAARRRPGAHRAVEDQLGESNPAPGRGLARHRPRRHP
ncbi:hypothetical protein [Frankia sp. Cj5]|uniref:hypothetical protein n=1 Tax=Frankia sp. Cj5 TaxID=2880978 RepID=UPI001EF4094E|nr:hypothetical protein [Frankia sp. Cj5]